RTATERSRSRSSKHLVVDLTTFYTSRIPLAGRLQLLSHRVAHPRPLPLLLQRLQPVVVLEHLQLVLLPRVAVLVAVLVVVVVDRPQPRLPRSIRSWTLWSAIACIL